MITIGDEPVLGSIPASALKRIMGTNDVAKKDYSSVELLDLAREMYDVYHLHIMQGHHGRSQNVMDGWKQLMGDNLITVQDYHQVSTVMSEVIFNSVKKADTGIGAKESSTNEEML